MLVTEGAEQSADVAAVVNFYTDINGLVPSEFVHYPVHVEQQVGAPGSYACGCADGSCGDIQTLAGEDNMRRWVVYEIPLEAIQATLGNVGKPKKSKKKKKSSKSEL